MRCYHRYWAIAAVLMGVSLPATGYYEQEKDRYIPELVYMLPSMSPISGGGPTVMIWKDMHNYINLFVPPKIKLISMPGGPKPGEGYILSMRHYNQEDEVIDFRRYAHMEPEDNEKLVERYSNSSVYVIAEVSAPFILNYPHSGEFEMFLLTSGIYEYLMKPPCWNGPHADQIRPEDYACPAELTTADYLTSTDNSWRFWFHNLPIFRDMFPMQGPAVGGTLVSIMGDNFPVWPNDRPVVKIVSSGIDQHVKAESLTSNLLTFYMPPGLVGDSNTTQPAQVYLSATGGRFYRCNMTWLYYDDTRIRWGDTLAISPLFWRQYVIHSDSVNFASGSHGQIVTATPEVMEDTRTHSMLFA